MSILTPIPPRLLDIGQCDLGDLDILDSRERVIEYPLKKPPSSTLEPWINDQQAAEFLGVASKTVQRMARRGELPCRRMGKFYRYKKSVLDQWMLDHKK